MPQSIFIRYLTFAGFYLQLKFYPAEHTTLSSIFIKELLSLYRANILTNLPPGKKCSYYLEVKENRKATIIRRHEKNKKWDSIILSEIGKKKRTIYYGMGIGQFQIILRYLLQQLLSQTKGFLLHASAVANNHQLLVFTGKTGSGKSTIVKLLTPTYQPIADDSLIIKKDFEYIAYPTPFIEKTKTKKITESLKIKGIFFLHQSNKNKINRIVNKSLLMELCLEQLWIDDNYQKKLVNNLISFVNNYDAFFDLSFNKNKRQTVALVNNFIAQK